MKYIEILNLADALSKINLPGVKFAYGISKNLNLLKPEVNALNEARKPSPEFGLYDKERVELAQKHAEKDEKGKTVTLNGQYQIVDQEAFDKEFKELQEKHKETLEKREVQMKEFNDLLDKEVEITLHKIKLEDVPQNITTAQMNSIYSIIEE